MKTLRFIGMAIVAIIMSVNFVACSDDDDDIDVSQLEGTWGLVHDTGWEESDGDKDSWDDTHTPNNNHSDWTYEGNQTISINGNTVTINKTNTASGFFESDENTIIEYLTSDKLALRFKNENTETEKYNYVMEFVRME